MSRIEIEESINKGLIEKTPETGGISLTVRKNVLPTTKERNESRGDSS